MAIYFKVQGRGEFPVDMLRHDEAWPLSSDDAGKIAVHYGQDDQYMGTRTVELGSNRKQHEGPSFDRWESFGWKVLQGDKGAYWRR